MKHVLLALILLGGIGIQPLYAEEEPAETGDTTAQPADATQDSGGKEKKPAEEEEEPDCD